MTKQLNFVELFAGAGGLSEGFIQEGFQPIAFVESDMAACNTLRTRMSFHWLKSVGKVHIYADYLTGSIHRDALYTEVPARILRSIIHKEIHRENVGALCSEIDRRLKGRKLDVLIGGLPCQAYSIIGRSRDPTGMVLDERNFLYRCFGLFWRNTGRGSLCLKMLLVCFLQKTLMEEITLTAFCDYFAILGITRTTPY